MRCRFAKTRLDMRDGMLVLRRHGKKQRRNPRFEIKLQPGNDHRHTQGMRPDPLAAPQQTIAINLPGIGDGIVQPFAFGRRQARRKNGKELREIALGGDRMNNGYHAVIIPTADCLCAASGIMCRR